MEFQGAEGEARGKLKGILTNIFILAFSFLRFFINSVGFVTFVRMSEVYIDNDFQGSRRERIIKQDRPLSNLNN
jgi:hypothetical protein